MSRPNLPVGFQPVQVTSELEQGVVDVINEAFRWETGGGDFTNLEDLRAEWQHEDFNRNTDALAITGPDGKVVAYADLMELNALHVRHGAFVQVHPDYQGQGIGAYLLQWTIDRACHNIPLAPEGARVVLHQFANSANQAAYDLLTSSGFKVARQSFRMRIELDKPPAPPKIPPGFEIRPIHAGEERALLEANFEAFQDHWGAVEEPFEEYYKRWMHYIESDPIVDPAFWFLALESGSVAGAMICNPKTNEDPEMGWVWQLSVREPWRKRGLGLALLQQAFYSLHKNGSKRVALGVDAESLTGANRLYERAGMHVWKKNYTYEYELRPGSDLMRK